MRHQPLVYFWIAELKNGRAIPQFDPSSGVENRFDAVDVTKLQKFGWYPFNVKLCKTIYNCSQTLAVPTFNPSYVIKVKDGQKLVAKREITIKTFKFHRCGKCGHEWLFTSASSDPIIGLPTSHDAFVEHIPIRDDRGERLIEFVSPTCPNCGYHDCNAVMKADKIIKVFAGEKREIVYVLGVEGGRIARIKENGEVE